MAPANNAPLTLSAVLGSYPHTEPLKRGTVTSGRLALDFIEMKPTNSAFKPMVRELRFDLCEMAIVTYLQAKAAGKPLILLPAVMLCRFQQAYALYNAGRGLLAPNDLKGKRIGVRAYTQTTGAWVRGILKHEYGFDWRDARWVTFEDPHVAEYRDPPNVERAPAGKTLIQMLLDGEIAAALGELSDDARLKPLIPEPEKAATAWYEKYRMVPANHFVTMRAEAADKAPWVLEEIYRLLQRAKAAAPMGAPAPAAGTLDMHPFGIEANRRALETIIDFAVEQDLIPRRTPVDALFDDRVRAFAS